MAKGQVPTSYVRALVREEIRAELRDESTLHRGLKTTKTVLIELIEIVGLLTILAIALIYNWSKILAALH